MKKIIILLILIAAVSSYIFFVRKKPQEQINIQSQQQSPPSSTADSKSFDSSEKKDPSTTAVTTGTAAIQKYGERVEVKSTSECDKQVYKSALVSFIDKKMTILSGAFQCFKLLSKEQKRQAELFIEACAMQKEKSFNYNGKNIELSEANLTLLAK